MNVNEYIASGIVELYAMNALSPEEKKEFERLIVLYPEIGTELRNTEKALENYASSQSLNPRPVLRERIMNEIKNDDKKVKAIAKNKSNSEDYSLTYKYLIAACLAALVVSTFASWFFYSRWDEAEERYTSLLNEKNELAENYNLVKAAYDVTLANLIVMRDETMHIIVLNSADTSKHYQARVYWNKQTQRSYIDVLSMPSPGEGKQFQLWALVSGKPVDAGVFVTGQEGIQRVKDVLNADTWLVTLEPKGGSLSPTMDQTYLLSKGS